MPLSKNTDFDAHRWVFSRIVYSCFAAYRLVLMRRRRGRSTRIFSHAEGALRSEKSVEICEICGRQLSAQCAKEQAECIILPRISQISTDAMRGAFIKKHGLHRCARMGLFTDSLLLLRCLPLGFDAPSAQRIATDFFAGGELCGRMSHDGLAWYAKNLWKSAGSVGDN